MDIFFPISNFAMIEKMGSGKVLIQDGKEISLLKSGAVKKKKKKKTVKGSRHTRQFFSSVRVIFLFGHFAQSKSILLYTLVSSRN